MQTQVQENTLYLSGEISVRTLNIECYQRFVHTIQQDNIRVLNWQNISKADSAALSLLLATLRIESKIVHQNLPEILQSLAELYDIQDWISNE